MLTIPQITIPTTTPMPRVGTFLSNVSNTLNQVIPIVGQVKTISDTLKYRTPNTTGMYLNPNTGMYQSQPVPPVAQSNGNTKTLLIGGGIALAALAVYAITKKSK